jgi:hypothetical protein
MENEKLLLAAILVAAMFIFRQNDRKGRVKIKYDQSESLGNTSSLISVKLFSGPCSHLSAH